MKKLPLTKGQFAIVDDADYPKLSAYNWCALRSGGNVFYATRSEKQSEEGKKGRRTIYLQRHIVNAPDGVKVKFVNGNTLDCRRRNLVVDGALTYRMGGRTPGSPYTPMGDGFYLFTMPGSFLSGRYFWEVPGGGFCGGAVTLEDARCRRDGPAMVVPRTTQTLGDPPSAAELRDARRRNLDFFRMTEEDLKKMTGEGVDVDEPGGMTGEGVDVDEPVGMTGGDLADPLDPAPQDDLEGLL